MAKAKPEAVDLEHDESLGYPFNATTEEEALARIAEAQETLDAAIQEHADAVAAHAEIVNPTVEAVYGQHIFVDLGDDKFIVMDAPPDWEATKPATLLINGRNVEHVKELPDANGRLIWAYRRM